MVETSGLGSLPSTLEGPRGRRAENKVPQPIPSTVPPRTAEWLVRQAPKRLTSRKAGSNTRPTASSPPLGRNATCRSVTQAISPVRLPPSGAVRTRGVAVVRSTSTAREVGAVRPPGAREPTPASFVPSGLGTSGPVIRGTRASARSRPVLRLIATTFCAVLPSFTNARPLPKEQAEPLPVLMTATFSPRTRRMRLVGTGHPPFVVRRENEHLRSARVGAGNGGRHQVRLAPLGEGQRDLSQHPHPREPPDGETEDARKLVTDHDLDRSPSSRAGRQSTDAVFPAAVSERPAARVEREHARRAEAPADEKRHGARAGVGSGRAAARSSSAGYWSQRLASQPPFRR